jgi:hypothetical protein
VDFVNGSLDRCSCENARREGKLAEPGASQFTVGVNP